MSDTAHSAVNVAPLEDDLLCPGCGYNLRGLTEHRCPECGEDFGPAALSETALPWTHRRRIGRVRAYLQTVGMATFHPRRLAAEIAHPQSYRDSQRFRWLTIGLAWLSLLGTTLYNWGGAGQTRWILPDGGGMGAGSAAIHLIAGLAFFAVITGIPSYFLHPRNMSMERQNRAVALSYYTCAPLAVSPLVLVLTWLIPEVEVRFIVTWVLTLLQFALWWRSLIVLHARGLQPAGVLRRITVPIALLVCAVVIGGISLLAVSLILRFAAVVVFSLQG